MRACTLRRAPTSRRSRSALITPEGSTSYYFRTRISLLRAIVGRLAELDTADVPVLPNSSASALADSFTAAVERLLTDGRDRQLARYELSLEATRRPELRAALNASSLAIHEVVAERFAALGVVEPRRRAAQFLALLDGLLLTEAIGGSGVTDTAMSTAERRDVIGRLLQSLGVPT